MQTSVLTAAEIALVLSWCGMVVRAAAVVVAAAAALEGEAQARQLVQEVVQAHQRAQSWMVWWSWWLAWTMATMSSCAASTSWVPATRRWLGGSTAIYM